MEQIYTIPVNEAFEAVQSEEHAGCPFCRLKKKLEEDELSIILGASMMEPDIRIKTNEAGFCHDHFGKMLEKGNRLSLALILESHLAEMEKKLTSGGLSSMMKGGVPKRLSDAVESCYICDRIEYSFSRMVSTAVMLWETDAAFRKKCGQQEYICLPHVAEFLAAGKAGMSKKVYADFEKSVMKVAVRRMSEVREGIAAFVKKFDYRYAGEALDNAAGAPEAAVEFLSGKE